jgi:hypothetical protein
MAMWLINLSALFSGFLLGILLMVFLAVAGGVRS